MKTKTPTLIVAFAVALLVLSAAPKAFAECAPFPRITIWGDYTHDTVRHFVANKLDGDWDKYVGHLGQRLESLRAIQIRNDTLTLTFQGKRIELNGAKLGAYVAAAAMRLDVASCLAAEASGANLQHFATAAGGADTRPVPAPVLTEPEPTTVRTASATVATDGLKLQIASECRGGIATFKITNQGDAWPKSGVVGIYRQGQSGPERITNRRIRFTKGQTSSFRVRSAGERGGNLAVYISPDWTERRFTEDATLSCS